MRLALLGFVACAAGAAAQSPVASLTIEQLRSGADAYWGSIQTISASYSSSMPGPVTDDVVRDHRAAVTLKGDKVYFDHTYGGSPAFEGRVFNGVHAFDGAHTVDEDTTNGGAFIKAGRTIQSNPRCAPGFLDLCMLASAGGSFGDQESSLVAFLNDPNVRLRPTLEDIDAHWCHVVDLPGSAGLLRLSVWIDADRGFLPVRQVHWRAGGTALLDIRTDEAIQLPTGHWVPVRGRKGFGVLPGGVPELSSPHLVVVQVERDGQGRYVVAVNQPVDDSLFALDQHLPPGFMIRDLDTGAIRIASSRDYERAGQAIETVIANTDLRLKHHGVPVQATRRDLSHRDARLMLAHAGAGLGGAVFASIVGLAVLRRRRVRPR